MNIQGDLYRRTQSARLTNKTLLSPEISDFEFEIEEGRFAGLEEGAHVDVHLEGDLIRQYSIWYWSLDGRVLNIAVKREDRGRWTAVFALWVWTNGIAFLVPRNTVARI